MADDDNRRPVTVWLSPLELAALDQIAAAEQRTRSATARILLAEAIQRRTGNPR